LDALRPFAKKVATSGCRIATEDAVVVVMVANLGHSRQKMCGLKSWLQLIKCSLFATDKKTKQFTQFLGIEVYYNTATLIGEAEYTFGDGNYARLMMGKVYSVQMVNDLGYFRILVC
jgi:hypothetical protein